MTSSDLARGWHIVPYEGRSPFKKVRVRDDSRVRDVLRHLHNNECVALIGSPFSEKSALLNDISSALEAADRYVPLHIDLWQVTSEDEAAFFTSLAAVIGGALRPRSGEMQERSSAKLSTGEGVAPPRGLSFAEPHSSTPLRVPDARSFQNFLSAATDAQQRHLALLIDHLQALPHDLVHSLLLALRAAYMERPVDAPRQLVAVVTGGMNLVGLSTGATSPFNIARPVVAAPLTKEQSWALAERTLAAHDCPVSDAALNRIIEWAGGDRYDVPLLCAQAATLVRDRRRSLVDRRVVDRAASQLFLAGPGNAPVREAIRMIEEDPDTILDVLTLLQHGSLARSRARQMPTRTGADRLQLSGAVVLADNCYSLKNLAYREALARHFTAERVGHILRIAGRWQEAIAYLAPQVHAARMASAAPRPSLNGPPAGRPPSPPTPLPPEEGQDRSRGAGEGGVLPGAAWSGARPPSPPTPLPEGEGSQISPLSPGKGQDRSSAAGEGGVLPSRAKQERGPVSAETRPYALVAQAQWAAAQSQLLEATVQSIYAADSLPKAWEILAHGLEQGFGLEAISIYRAAPCEGRLELAYPPPADSTAGSGAAKPATIPLDDPDRVEARAYAYGSYALRGTRGATRLVAVLREASRGRRLGVVTIERYVEVRDTHELPGQLPDLLHFLEHAAGAIENVMIRAAYRAIGQAVLDAGTFRPTLERVLSAVAEGLGCDAANLYLLDPGQGMLEMAAGTGRLWSLEWQSAARFPQAGDHPAAACLRDGRLHVAPGSDERLNRALVEHFGLRRFTWGYLPLTSGGQPLGALELGYADSGRIMSDPQGRANLTAFANQVAIAVHNAQLLRRTDEALARRVVELEKLRSSSLAISATLDAPTVLKRIIRDLRALFPGSETTIWEREKGTGLLKVLQSTLADPDYLAQRLDGDSFTGRAVARGQVQIAEDLAAFAGAEEDPAVRLGLRGLVVVPLVSHQDVLGAIDLYTYAPASQTVDPGAELLKAFAAHAAVAIENARLHQEELARQRLEQELSVAREIQKNLLPTSCPEAPRWQFAATYEAARVVGGDFYDFCEPPGEPRRIGIVVADVTDKGVPAAIFMALSRTIIRTMAMGGGRGPASVLTHANRLILNDSTSDFWLTAVYAALEPATGRLTYANAGHCRPLWYQAQAGQAVELGARGILLGAFEDITLDEQTVDLAPGDAVVLYTDGISEAVNSAGEMFGDERVVSVLCANASGSADDILSAITRALSDFTAGAEQADDITCVVVKRE